VDALIFTTSDGWALDTVVLKRIFESADETRRAQRISDTIESVLRGDLRLSEAVENRTAPQKKDDLFDITPQIVISNSLSDHSTVIEIACLDRPGLLFDITQALREINLKIRSAHIATFGERAVDVFYVRDLFGHRIENKPRQNKIRALLNAAIDPKIPTRQAIRNVLMQPTGYEPTVS
jgi:[protein-PII] uridylyltransferase